MTIRITNFSIFYYKSWIPVDLPFLTALNCLQSFNYLKAQSINIDIQRKLMHILSTLIIRLQLLTKLACLTNVQVVINEHSSLWRVYYEIGDIVFFYFSLVSIKDIIGEVLFVLSTNLVQPVNKTECEYIFIEHNVLR